MGIQAILALINAAIPNVANLIIAIKHANGTVSIGTLLSEADANFDQSIQQATAWLAQHPVAAPTTGTRTTPPA